MTHQPQWLQERADLLAQMTEWRERAEKAEADNRRLKSALADLVSWFEDEPSKPMWLIKAGECGADDAIANARATLAAMEATDGRE